MALIEGAPNTATQLDAALKQLYVDGNEVQAFLEGRPAYGLVNKDEQLGGRDEPIVVHWGRTGGRSSNFAAAQTVAAARPKQVGAFLITPAAEDFSLIRVPGNTLARVRNTSEAWADLVASLAQKGLDDGEANLADSLEEQIYRDGTGALALIGAKTDNYDIAGNADNDYGVITFSNPDDVLLFEYGEYVVCCASTGVVEANTICEVTKLDVPNGKIEIHEVTPGTDDNAGFDVGDYVAHYGDTLASGTTEVRMCGFASWIPTTAPTDESSTTFKGVDRSKHSRLYGKYLDYSAKSRKQALLWAATQLAKEGGAPDMGFIPFTDYRGLCEELGTEKNYVDMNAVSERGLVANVNFRAVYVHGPASSFKMVPAPKTLAQEAILIRSEDWTLHSCGPAINLEDRDGLTIMRHPTEDSYEGRMAFRGELSCMQPGRQGRVKLPSSV